MTSGSAWLEFAVDVRFPARACDGLGQHEEPVDEEAFSHLVQQVVTVELISGQALENSGGHSGSRVPNASQEPQDAGPEPAADQSDPSTTATIAFGTEVAELVAAEPMELPDEVDSADPGVPQNENDFYQTLVSNYGRVVGQATHEMTIEVLPGLGVQILFNNLLTYRDLEATFSAIGHPAIQAHWGSGVVFTNVQMLPFQYP